MQISINIQDDLYKKVVNSGTDIQTKFNEYLVSLFDKKETYLDSHQFQEDKKYFHNALDEIESGKVELLSQEEYDKDMNEFMKAL